MSLPDTFPKNAGWVKRVENHPEFCDCKECKELNEPESQSSTTYVICPHCLHQYEPEATDYNESEREEVCYHCGKKFMHCDEIEVHHNTRPIT